MKYFCKLKKEKDGSYSVSFPDLDGCLTCGDTKEEALANAHEALNGWIMSNCDRNIYLPEPIERKGRGFHAIPVKIGNSMVLALRLYRLQKGYTQARMAKALKMSQQNYAKIESPNHNVTVKTFEKVADAFPGFIEIKYNHGFKKAD